MVLSQPTLYRMLNHDTEGAQGRDKVISPRELKHAVTASRRWGGHDATTKSDSNAIQLNPAQQHEVFDRLCGPLKPKEKHETRGFTYKQCVLPLQPRPMLLILL